MEANAFVIIANGDFLVKEIILEAIQNKTVIALDGAMNHLYRLGIQPDILLGDFDSITPAVAEHFGVKARFADMHETDMPYQGNGIIIVPALNQNLTDLAKAIRYCDQQQASDITLLCALGARIDQHEHAMRLLRSEYRKNRPMLLLTDEQTLRFAKDETVSFAGQPQDKCGILAYPQATISTQGLLYDVENFPLTFADSESVSNIMRENQAFVKVTGEAMIVMPPLLKSQRVFMQKTPSERLELKLRDAH